MNHNELNQSKKNLQLKEALVKFSSVVQRQGQQMTGDTRNSSSSSSSRSNSSKGSSISSSYSRSINNVPDTTTNLQYINIEKHIF